MKGGGKEIIMKKKLLLSIFVGALFFGNLCGVYAESEINSFSDSEIFSDGDVNADKNTSNNTINLEKAEKISEDVDIFSAEDRDSKKNEGSFLENSETSQNNNESKNADVVVDTGICGENIVWELLGTETDGYTLHISGEGEMYDFDYSKVPWEKYSYRVMSLFVDEGIINIGKSAFYAMPLSKQVILPNTLEKIGERAFESTGIEKITLPESVTTVDREAFFNCQNLKEFIFPPNITEISFGVLADCFKLYTVTIPDGVEHIYNNAFQQCYSLYDIQIPASVKHIYYRAFVDCTSLRNVTISSDIAQYSIDSYAFAGCSSLNTINLPKGLSEIDERTFLNCSSLEEVILPNGITKIGGYAFDGCSSMKKLVLPDSVKTIETGAFANCGNLTSILLPLNLQFVDGSVFDQCNNLLEILVNQQNNNYSSIDGVLFNKEKTILHRYPEGKEESEYTIPTKTQSIAGGAFKGCKNLITINVSNVSYFEAWAFQNCENLKNISIPKTDTVIRNSLFSGCKSLDKTIIPDNIVSLDAWAFENCVSLSEITIPASVSLISHDVFKGCSGLKEIFFEGDAPLFDETNFGIFDGVIATAYYPANNSTWTPDVMKDYGGKITWIEWIPDIVPEPVENEIDAYIIEQVKKYTSEEMNAQYEEVVWSTETVEMKLKKMSEIFQNYGLTNIKEGTEYISNTISHRNAFRHLTTNETYLAYEFYNWLYSPEGTLARGILYADGLIFNGEVFSYFDLSTYVESDYPGVKKNKEMLKQFMSYEAPKNEVFAYANMSANFLSNLIELNNIERNDSIDELMKKIINATSQQNCEKYQRQLVNDYIIPLLKQTGTDTVYLDGEAFSNALNYASSILKCVGATTDDILGIMNLSNEIAVYEKYKGFLTTICNHVEVSFEMRLAAYSLLNEIENGYFNKIKSIIGNFISLESSVLEVNKTIMNGILGTGGELLYGALNTIKLGVYISNIVIDMGDYVKQAAYTQGYAELSVLYSIILQEDKNVFLASPSAENAWKFFEDYTLLWNLRYQGEKQYLEMSDVKMFLFADIPTFDYDLKKELVEANLSTLDKDKFEFSEKYVIPDSIMYMKKAIIKCPVNVNVYLPDGTLIGSLKDGIPTDFTNEYGRFAVVYLPYSDEYVKVICQSTNIDLRFEIQATAKGLVDFQIATAGNSQIYSFHDVIVEAGDIIEVTSKLSQEESTYNIYPGGNKEEKQTENLDIYNSGQYVPVNNIQLESLNMVLSPGETAIIKAVACPANATNKDLEWISADETIAAVKNGVVTAEKTGKTTIYIKALDGDNIKKELSIEVKNKKKSLEDENIRINIDKQQYKGELIEPKIEIIDGATILVEDKDYTVAFKNNDKPGTATAIITGIGNYTGNIQKNFEIVCTHQWKVIIDKPPTYTETGILHEECTICGIQGKESTIPVLTKPDDPYIPPYIPTPTPLPDNYPEGSQLQSDGSIKTPNGIIIKKDGTIILPDGTQLLVNEEGKRPSIDKEGNVEDVFGVIIKADGTIILPGKDLISSNDDIVISKGKSEEVPRYNSQDSTVSVKEKNIIILPNKVHVEIRANAMVQCDGTIQYNDGVFISPEGLVHHMDGSIQFIDGQYLRPAKTVIQNIIVKGNLIQVQLQESTQGAQGFDYVISDNPNCLLDKDYLIVNKNIHLPKTMFQYLQKGTYYTAVHAWMIGSDGKKIFGEWSDIKKVKVSSSTPEKPQIIKVKVADRNVTVTYSKSKRSQGYDVILGTDVRKVSGEIRPVDYGRAVKKTGGNTYSVTFRNCPKGAIFYAGVHAWNRTSEDKTKVFSPWSNIKKIKVK